MLRPIPRFRVAINPFGPRDTAVTTTPRAPLDQKPASPDSSTTRDDLDRAHPRRVYRLQGALWCEVTGSDLKR